MGTEGVGTEGVGTEGMGTEMVGTDNWKLMIMETRRVGLGKGAVCGMGSESWCWMDGDCVGWERWERDCLNG